MRLVVGPAFVLLTLGCLACGNAASDAPVSPVRPAGEAKPTPVQEPEAPRLAPPAIALSVGDDGVLHYSDEPQVRGPVAVAAVEDGTFWIVDSVASRVVHVDEQGSLRGSLALPAAEVTAIAATKHALYLLAHSAAGPTLYELLWTGTVGAQLPVERTAKDLMRQGSLIVIRGEVTQAYDTVQGVLRAHELTWFSASPGHCELHNAGEADHHCVTVRGGGFQMRLDAGANVLRVDVARTFASGALLLEVVLGSAHGNEDTQLWRIAADGKLLGKARFRRAGATFVQEPLAIRDDGVVYALVTRPTSAALERLSFTKTLPSSAQ